MNLFAASTQMAQLLNIPSDQSKYSDSPNQLTTNENSLKIASKFLDDLKHLSTKITLKTKPDGSQLYPARSCRDIADYYPEKPNG